MPPAAGEPVPRSALLADQEFEMRYIALEEAFSIRELDDRQPPPWPENRFSRRSLADWARRLPDFTEFRLPEMDAPGIDVQVLSLTVPGLQGDQDATAARADARLANDYLAEVIGGHPDRFRGFAALPMQDPSAAAAELARCVRQLGFRGALVNDHLQGHYLDEPRYDEVWAALEELSVPLYLHPGAPPADHWNVLAGRPELYGATWSWAAETGGHALRAIYGGVFDRHPSATLILGHMGEFLPFMAAVSTRATASSTPTFRCTGHRRPISAPTSSSRPAGFSLRPRSPGPSWRSVPTRSCSPSTTPTSPATRRWPDWSRQRSARPTGRRSHTAMPSASSVSDPEAS
jgi:predicted TIM-barrel fold metal-dependent hydrolase